MQKRARAVETKMRRTMKRSNRQMDAIKEGMSAPLTYTKLATLWMCIITLDAVAGFRFELLWPFWLFVRAGYEAMHKNQSGAVALTSHNSALQKFSVLFVCVTATSDLICYLFIPVRVLIFLATTYVWVNLIWHTHGGFVRTLSAIFGDRTQGVPIVLLWAFVVFFELSLRVRCDYLVLVPREGGGSMPNYMGPANGAKLQTPEDPEGMSPLITRNLNAFFGAHCVGFPIVLVGFSLQYYYKEWRMKRKQGEVATKNEQLYRILVEALPAVYEGPKDYLKPCLDDECYLMDVPTSSAIALPALMNGTANGNGTIAKKNGYHKNQKEKQRGGKTRTNGLHPTPPAMADKKRDEKRHEDIDDDESDDDFGWGERSAARPVVQRTPGSLFIVRFLWEALVWSTSALGALLGRTQQYSEEAASSCGGDEDDDDLLLLGDEKKNGRMNGDGKNRNNTVVGRQKRGKQQQQQQQHQHQQHQQQNQQQHQIKDKLLAHEKSAVQLTNGHHRAAQQSSMPVTRDSSNDTSSTHDNNNDTSGLSMELEKLRSEIHHLKSAEADARIQLTVYETSEKTARQDAAHLRSRVEQVEAKYATMEKLRDVDRQSLVQLEKKYAELMNRKNDVERDLLAERKARKEDGGKRTDTAEIQREKERTLEREVDRLRLDVRARDDRLIDMENEVLTLRKYKELNDVDALKIEVRVQKEKLSHLEASLASENKLKQELFRALGDAKANNALLDTRNTELEGQLRSQQASVHHHHHHHNDEKTMSIHHSQQTNQKQPLSVNVSRQSPYSEKTSPASSNGSQQQNVPTPTAAPPPYTMALQQSKQPDVSFGCFYNSFQLQSSPTGEHHLFDVPPSAQHNAPLASCGALSPQELEARRGKFGAPTNPSRIN